MLASYEYNDNNNDSNGNRLILAIRILQLRV